jgi:small multidrug resistance pump
MSPSLIYAALGLAIAAEVIATTALARSESFTRLGPSLVTVAGYSVAFYFLSIALRFMPTGVVYAVWSGLGIVLIAAIAWIWFGERLDLPAVIGMGLIIAGVVIVNVFSKTVPH